MKPRQLKSDRLLLRQWQHGDYALFALLNSDPDVMRFFPGTLNKQESDALAQKLEAELAERGWGVWAVERLSDQQFMGFTGLSPFRNMPFADGVEIAWRLNRPFWGQGFATEAARAALDFAFNELALDEIMSFTACANQRSIAVMDKLGMENTKQNFLHPRITDGHPLQEHVLYRLGRDRYLRQAGN